MKIIFTNKVPSLGGLFEIYFYFSVFSFYQKSIKIMVANPGGWEGHSLIWPIRVCADLRSIVSRVLSLTQGAQIHH